MIVFKVFAFPPASIEWTKNRKRMDLINQTNSSLMLPNVQYLDYGRYEAVARNILGEVRLTTLLIIRDPGG